MRTVLGALVGLCAGVFFGLDLVLLGVVAFASAWVPLSAVAGSAAGAYLGGKAAARRHRS